MNYRVSMMALILLVASFVCNNGALSVATNDDDNLGENQNVQAENGGKLHISIDEKICTIEQIQVTKIPGRCIRLLGGRKACVAGDFMDPIADSCNER